MTIKRTSNDDSVCSNYFRVELYKQDIMLASKSISFETGTTLTTTAQENIQVLKTTRWNNQVRFGRMVN